MDEDAVPSPLQADAELCVLFGLFGCPEILKTVQGWQMLPN